MFGRIKKKLEHIKLVKINSKRKLFGRYLHGGTKVKKIGLHCFSQIIFSIMETAESKQEVYLMLFIGFFFAVRIKSYAKIFQDISRGICHIDHITSYF